MNAPSKIAVATAPHRPRAVPPARSAGATSTSAEVAGGRGQASDWHRRPQARAVLENIDPADFRCGIAGNIWGSLFDKTELRPVTPAAWAVYDRLENLRRGAVTAEVGCTFEATQCPYDETRAARWLDLIGSIPDVSEVIAAELASRAGGAA
ncbi:hypothetical protein [Pelagerythrobacter marinus]|uniref:hypothetical protein n=1 Tax=Pelagerythrobacter marinus TaxID=538382 RepID=UPI002AC9D36D|nr:hypothetical protein [Pelagerythrobacter marinus]WPZ05628.1 hypothetical protein T8T98_09315 [Pelagerythrobacter marinus]